jgi:hypothetical protein
MSLRIGIAGVGIMGSDHARNFAGVRPVLYARVSVESVDVARFGGCWSGGLQPTVVRPDEPAVSGGLDAAAPSVSGLALDLAGRG